MKDPHKYGLEGNQEGRFWIAKIRPEKTIAPTCVSEEKGEVGRDHMTKLTNQVGSSFTWEETKLGAPKQLIGELHESGKVNASGGKTEEKENLLSESSPDLNTTQPEPIEDMHWEKATHRVWEPDFEFALAPNPVLNEKEGSLNNLDIGRGLMAISYDLKLGWTMERLGPKSGH